MVFYIEKSGILSVFKPRTKKSSRRRADDETKVLQGERSERNPSVRGPCNLSHTHNVVEGVTFQSVKKDMSTSLRLEKPREGCGERLLRNGCLRCSCKAGKL